MQPQIGSFADILILCMSNGEPWVLKEWGKRTVIVWHPRVQYPPRLVGAVNASETGVPWVSGIAGVRWMPGTTAMQLMETSIEPIVRENCPKIITADADHIRIIPRQPPNPIPLFE